MESQSGGSEGPVLFTPNEELVTTLMTTIGFTRNAVIKALFYTGNTDANMAATWLFENQESPDLDTPLENELQGTSDSSDDELLDGADLYKMVFVVNGELPMGVGKTAAQVAHAAINLYRLMTENDSVYAPMLMTWEQFGETKIVLRGETAMQLQQLADKAQSVGLPHYIVQDAGHTQVAPGSKTVLGIMGKIDLVDQVTGSLKLLS